MKNGKYCIAIMSVGSGVGQSIITSCNLSKLPITTVGLGMNPMAFGAYECDLMDYVPLIYSDNYISELIKKCTAYDIDLIIPGSDDEAFILARHKQVLKEAGFKVLVSEENLFKLVRDKALMCEKLSPIVDIFVKSYSLAEIQMQLEEGDVTFPLIAKPRDGYASRGIEILLDKSDFIKIGENHIIQELAIPHQNDPFREKYLKEIAIKNNAQVAEISIQVVTDKNGDVIGKMSSYNKLNNGVPIEIIPYENEYVWSEIDKLLPTLKELGHRGPLNIQGRLTDNGLKLFEMNARFTGITGLRAIMGFNEVETCIKDWLNIDMPITPLEINHDKFGIRQVVDKIVSLDVNKEVRELSLLLNKRHLKPVKDILVTGASGYLGQAIIRLLSDLDYNVKALSRNKSQLMSLYKTYDNVVCYDNSDLYKGRLRFGLIDCMIHCAFARPHRSNLEVAESLKYTEELFVMAAKSQVARIINISSQSVYGTKQPIYWQEETPIEPESVYGQAKYSTELMASTVKQFNNHSNVTSLRLSGLSGGQSGLVPVDLLYKLVESCVKNKAMKIIDGSQMMQKIDVRDAAAGIVNLLKTDSRLWDSVYNLGVKKSYTVKEIVGMVSEIAHNKYGIDVTIETIDKKVSSNFGMDSSKFYNLTNWWPKYSLEDTIISLFEYIKSEEKNIMLKK